MIIPEGTLETLLENGHLVGSFFFFFNIYSFFRDRERPSTSGGGAERESQNLKQAPGSKL